MIDPLTLAVLAFLGAVVGLDFVSFPQAMLSRPLVAATLGGAVCGHAGTGMLIGVLLECFALETMPFGASQYPEWGPSSVAAGAVAAMSSGDPESAQRIVPFAVFAGLAAAMVGGRTLVWLRRFNLSVTERYRTELTAGDTAAVQAVHWTGLVIDFGRAFVATAVFVLAILPARTAVLAAMHAVSGTTAIVFTSALAVGVAGGAAWKVVHTTKGYAGWLLGGLLAGTAVTLFVL